RAFLQSTIPAPVFSRRDFTALAVTSAITYSWNNCMYDKLLACRICRLTARSTIKKRSFRSPADGKELRFQEIKILSSLLLARCFLPFVLLCFRSRSQMSQPQCYLPQHLQELRPIPKPRQPSRHRRRLRRLHPQRKRGPKPGDSSPATLLPLARSVRLL